MEKISDFLKELKDRLSSPLIGSFLIAWLIINWKVPIGLIFYKTEQLNKDGYSSFIDLINKNIGALNCFWIPLVIALAYTFVFPFIKSWISSFQTWINTWTDNRNLNIAKEAFVPMAKFIQLKTDYANNVNILKELIEKDGQYKTENESLNLVKTNLEETIKSYLSYDEPSFLDGQWNIKYTNTHTNFFEKVTISSGQIFHSNDLAKDEMLYKLASHSYNQRTGELIMILEGKDKDIKPFYQIMRRVTPENNFWRNNGPDAIILEMRKT